MRIWEDDVQILEPLSCRLDSIDSLSVTLDILTQESAFCRCAINQELQELTVCPLHELWGNGILPNVAITLALENHSISTTACLIQPFFQQASLREGNAVCKELTIHLELQFNA